MQTEVQDTQDATPVPGVISDLAPHYIRSYVNQEASAEIPFGILVVQATDPDDGCKLPVAAAMPLGVTVHSHAYSYPGQIGDTGVKPMMTLGVMRQGVIWVTVEDAVTPDDPVRVRITAGGGEQKGAFRTAQDSTDCALVQGCQFLTAAGAGEIAQLQVDMTKVAVLTADS